MNKSLRSVFLGAACAMLAAGCGKNEGSAVASNGQPSQIETSSPPRIQVFARDPSVPDASAVFAAQAALDKSKGTAETIIPPQAPTPQKKMTKQEESKAMPMPGQVNNHSTPAAGKTGAK